MQRKTLHALLIENEADDASLIRLALPATDNPKYQIDTVPSLNDATLNLKDTSYDAVLGLPGAAGGDGWDDLGNRQWREALSTVPARQYHDHRKTPGSDVSKPTQPIGAR